MEQRHRKCKTTIYKLYFMKTLLYGAKAWTGTKTEESKIQAAKMTFLTAIMGKTKKDRIRNAHIREELRMEDVQNQIEGNRLRWFRHVKRMDKHGTPNGLPEMKTAGKRPRGR
jgi:hypothetical protein